MIGYPRGQDGAILPARYYPPCPARKFPRKPYNKLASFFFCVFMDLDSVSVHKHAKKERGQYPATLTSHLVNNPYISTEQAWSIKDLLYGIKNTKKNIRVRGTRVRNPEQARWCHLARLDSQSQRSIWFITELVI